MEKKNECKHGEWKYEPKFNRDGASRFIFMKVGAVVCSFMKNIPHEHYNSIRPVYCDITRQRECSRFEEREGPRAGLFYLYTDTVHGLSVTDEEECKHPDWKYEDDDWHCTECDAAFSTYVLSELKNLKDCIGEYLPAVREIANRITALEARIDDDITDSLDSILSRIKALEEKDK